MSSLRRIIASRANGARSHGPETPEGKRQSGQNALRLSWAQHIEHFGPLDGVEFRMIEEASSYGRLRRLWAIENSLLEEGLAVEPAGDDVGRITAAFRKLGASPELALIHRYETRLHMMYQRALHNILLLRTAGIPNERT
jgi:hypothetical protein